MGTILHPRFGHVDIKMVAETRLSWNMLILITSSAFLTAWTDPSYALSTRLGLCVMLLAHGTYTNACAKGEHFIPTTWDIVEEKLEKYFGYLARCEGKFCI